MKTLALAIALILLASCRNRDGQKRPKLEDLEQLSPTFVVVEINNTKYISIEKSFCASRTYRISKHLVGAVNDPIALDIMECDKAVGYAPSEYVVVATWLENMRVWLLGFLR